MKKWWSKEVIDTEYFKEKQKEFRNYQYNIYILHKVILVLILGCLKDSTLVLL